MIILKHLTVERFRLLREINLHFPQRGSILIQGPNEAGKSTLLESIYFALYGEPISPIASDRSRRTLDDLVLYGAAQATVTLTVSIGASEMTITRSIERGKGQQVLVQVRRLGVAEDEPITRLATANERIVAELGRMDGETLRNSCFIEQKRLSHLEELPGVEREATMRKLLGLEKLLRLTEQLKLTPADERMLLESTERLKLAEIQARIPELSQELARAEAALDAVAISEDLEEIKQQEEDIAEQQLSLQLLLAKRSELKGRLSRMQQLQKADITLGEIIAAYEAISEAQRELPELDQQIAELDRREREELPALEKRVRELTDLIRSFGTLERMSNDLLTTVGTIKQLEQELKRYQERERNNNELDAQIITTRLQLKQAQQALQEGQTGRAELEARLGRLRDLSERLSALRQAQEEYNHLLKGSRSAEETSGSSVAEENDIQLNYGGGSAVEQGKDLRDRLWQRMQEAEQELAQAEAEAQQGEQQADALEKRWRQLSLGRQLEEWQRVKGRSQDLAEAEQHVMVAYQNQERSTLAAVETRQIANRWLMIGIGAGALGLIFAASAFFAASLLGIFLAATLGLLALLCLAGAGWSWFQYTRTHKDARIAHERMQEAINQVGRMVAARETVIRTGGYLSSREDRHDALARVEQEIRSLGGNVPRSREEAQYFLQQLVGTGLESSGGGSPESAAGQDTVVDFAVIQQRLAEKRDALTAARNQVNAKLEALSVLRQEWKRGEASQIAPSRSGQFIAPNEEGPGNERDEDASEATLQAARNVIEDRQLEIATLANQEGLPAPSFARAPNVPNGSSSVAQPNPADLESLEIALAESIKATEQEIISADGTADIMAERLVLALHEELDKLLERKRKEAEFESPLRKLELAREQQKVLRTGLQGLQDSLRERVKPLGVAFGQAAVSNAEATARKHLEALQITLGNRIELQSRRTNFATVLKDRQDSLSDHYNQLAKLSASLGSWIVPPNPFTETLAELRTRCQQEIADADEGSILQALEKLQLQERASMAKVELCRHEIEEAQEQIAALLVQRSRPSAKSYSVGDIVAVWPLVGEYSMQDRSRLTEERALLEEELRQMEQQELELSARLQMGSSRLDLEQARLRKEQQERSYQTKKRGSLLVKATSERLLRKMLPRTEYYMQQILPLLTGGRYHDVRLGTKPVGSESGSDGTLEVAQIGSGGPFQLHVWDTGASEYIPKSLLSGGAADQLSFALRLAFAIAVLPRELAAAPGFLLLDEPLSSFDSGRTQALVDVVTGELLGQHFEQVLLVSHSGAFDPAMFPYHIYLDGGVIVESNLPVVPPFQAVGSNGHDKSKNRSPGMPASPATPVPAAIGLES